MNEPDHCMRYPQGRYAELRTGRPLYPNFNGLMYEKRLSSGTGARTHTSQLTFQPATPPPSTPAKSPAHWPQRGTRLFQNTGGDGGAVAGSAIGGNGFIGIQLIEPVSKVWDEDMFCAGDLAFGDLIRAAHIEHLYICFVTLRIEFVHGPLLHVI